MRFWYAHAVLLAPGVGRWLFPAAIEEPDDQARSSTWHGSNIGNTAAYDLGGGVLMTEDQLIIYAASTP